MTTKCLSCSYICPEIELNCPKCGSFYTVIIDSDTDEKNKPKSKNTMTKIKHKLEHILSHGVNND